MDCSSRGLGREVLNPLLEDASLTHTARPDEQHERHITPPKRRDQLGYLILTSNQRPVMAEHCPSPSEGLKIFLLGAPWPWLNPAEKRHALTGEIDVDQALLGLNRKRADFAR